MGCQPPVSLAGVCVFVSSIGFLSPIIMLFHPAKSLVNFLGVVSLWAGSVLYKKLSEKGKACSIKDLPCFWNYFLILIGAMFAGFFCDETGLFVYVINLVMLFPVLKNVRERNVLLMIYVLIPVAYLVMLRMVLPYIHFLLDGQVANLSHWQCYPHLRSLFFPNWNNLWINACWLFSDHPHLNFKLAHILSAWPVLIVQIVYMAFFAFLFYLFVKKNTIKTSDSLSKQMLLFAGLLIAYVFFHTFQLSSENYVWGIWWYGCLFSLVYVIFLTFLLQKVCLGQNKFFQKIFIVLVLVFVVHGLLASTYRVAIFKIQNHDRNNYTYRHIFDGSINPYTHFDFQKSWRKSNCAYLYTKAQWIQMKHKGGVPLRATAAQLDECKSLMEGDLYFPITVLYIPVELKEKK
jgi:hypothetical protein